MLDKIEYINSVKLSFVNFTAAGSYAQKMNAVNSMLEALQKSEDTEAQIIACLAVASSLADGLAESGLFSKTAVIPTGVIADALSFAKDSADLVNAWQDDTVVDKNWYAVTS